MISALWGPIGLVLDLIGVLMLGYDLIRVQRMLREQAAQDLSRFDEMAESYGGTEGWLQEIGKSARWIPQSAYWDHHAEDEISYNARHAIETVREFTECSAGLSEHLSKVVSLQKAQAEGNRRTARASLRYSLIGLAFVFFGFVFQMFGSLHIWSR